MAKSQSKFTKSEILMLLHLVTSRIAFLESLAKPPVKKIQELESTQKKLISLLG